MSDITLGVTVLDCPEPRALADFYAAVLDWKVDPDGYDEWVELIGPQGRRLAFQQSVGYRPPNWPSTENPQQFHLDFNVPAERMDDAERRVLELGAELLEGDHDGKRSWRVYKDPVGHPFCLCATSDSGN
ncbi:VOC family protein [Streptomyces alkaliterrae]|uniref:VOC family protein n=1 Tax=Streptomyces alkaliterrae TaxID=2213162 RepID=A0A5P0YRJ8_9ACTN|nr:VOC family protein [Streptomyces alkaliterrae]MBB1254380.1 VOC family protein [Streptomyces alkaliterrae]MBB1258425.1 VOC family protein [Streptomyces alkaliterrae]MQS02888.1 VOC family protein [Streptomyces alkaliterrae]